MSNAEKKIGKILTIKFGFGGYQDVQLGVLVVLGNGSWAVTDFRGHWGTTWSDSCRWSEDDRHKSLGETCMWVRDLLSAAKKTTLDQLVNVPVEVTFENQRLASWRILTEAL